MVPLSSRLAIVKRIAASLLCLVFLFGICACGTSTETVELTTENFNKYFFVDCSTANYEEKVTDLLGHKFSEGTADCSLRIGKKVECSPSNVAVTIEVISPTISWDETTQTVMINIYADGSSMGTASFTSETSLPGLLREPSFYTRIKDVSGSVIIKK